MSNLFKLKNKCHNYGCSEHSENFKVDNLLSELKTEYQKGTARKNLGIADNYALLWGNMKGNIQNQEDLVQLIRDNSGHINKDTLDTFETKEHAEATYVTKEVFEKLNLVLDNILQNNCSEYIDTIDKLVNELLYGKQTN